MTTSARISYFVKLAIADGVFYTIPRLLTALLIRLPRAIVGLVGRLCGLQKGTGGAPGERDIEVVYNKGDPRVARSFGLGPATGDGDADPRPRRCRSLRYSGPLYNGHIHTMFNGLRPVWHSFEYARHQVQSGDGQHLNVDVLLPGMIRGESGKDGDAVVRGLLFVIPGLLNASTTNYVRNFAYQAASSHFAVAVMNYRGMGSTPLEVPRLFSATYTEDIRYVLAHYFSPAQVRTLVGAEASAKDIPLIGVGFSLGGVTLIKYVSEEGLAVKRGAQKALGRGDGTPGNGVCRLDAVFAVTSPFDLVACDNAAQRPVYKALYEKPFAVGFRKFVRHNQKMIEALPNVDGKALFYGPHPLIKTMTSIRVFDELINASHNGFATAREYYAAANSIPWLRHSRTPCICISNRGDPVTGPSIPSEEWETQVVRDNSRVLYVCFPVGGHLGFVGRPWEEVAGGANAMERFVLDCASDFVESVDAGFRVPLA